MPDNNVQGCSRTRMHSLYGPLLDLLIISHHLSDLHSWKCPAFWNYYLQRDMPRWIV